MNPSNIPSTPQQMAEQVFRKVATTRCPHDTEIHALEQNCTICLTNAIALVLTPLLTRIAELEQERDTLEKVFASCETQHDHLMEERKVLEARRLVLEDGLWKAHRTLDTLLHPPPTGRTE